MPFGNYDQLGRDKERRRRWTELRELSQNRYLSAFFKAYAEYLEWDGIESDDRVALHRMANLAGLITNYEI